MEDNVSTQPAGAAGDTPSPFSGTPLKVVDFNRQEPEPTTPEPTNTEPPADPPTPEPDPTPEPFPYWKTLGEKLGTEFGSEEDVLASINESKRLRSEYEALKNKNPYEGLDPLALDVDKAVKAGIDVNLYLEARNMDLTKMDRKEILRKKFLLEKADAFRENPSLANRMFEREYATKYGILSQQLSEEELMEKSAQIEDAKLDLEAEDLIAKKFLQDWKAKNVTIPEPKPATQQPQISEEESLRRRDEYFTQVDSFVDSIDKLFIPVGDQEYAFGVEKYVDATKSKLKDPVGTLKNVFGVDVETGSVDPDKLGEAIVILEAFHDIGKPLSEFAIEKFNKQTVVAQTKTPAPLQTQTGGNPPERSEGEKIAEAFEAMRRSRRGY